MRYSIAQEIFARYPGFTRAVLIADGIDNSREEPELLRELALRIEKAQAWTEEEYVNNPFLQAWAEAFSAMGLNPKRYPPSVLNLVKRARSGKGLPYVNTLVAAFNCVSLRHLCPCGGDDLAAVQGDLRLGLAQGDEQYVPLGRPEELEHPPAGEIIYMDTAGREVFCRAWCWKNGERSKLLPSTSRAAVNIDILPPLGGVDARRIAGELASMLERFTGADSRIFFLDSAHTEFDF